MKPVKPIPATLSFDEAAAKTWDVAVVGAGCAGALAAHQVARRGLSVLLVDKAAFPRWKVCGCCINQRAQAALQSAGLHALLEENRALPLDKLRVAARGRSAQIPIPGYASLSRECLDAALVRSAIDAGAHFLPKTQASMGSVAEETRSLRLRTEGTEAEVVARLVLIADGLGGRLLRATDAFDSPVVSHSRIGAGALAAAAPDAYAPGTIYMACAQGGYAGLVRLEDGRLDIAAAFDAELVRREGGLPGAASFVLDQAGFPAIPGIDTLTWRGTPALTRTANRISAHRALVLGDAAGYIEPFTGEGMAWAMTSAVSVAELAPAAIEHFDTSVERAWSKTHRSIVTGRQMVCRAVAAGLRRPGLVSRSIDLLSYAPVLVSPFVRHVNAPMRLRKGD
jgi:flavin-dependent dehydrogenase